MSRIWLVLFAVSALLFTAGCSDDDGDDDSTTTTVDDASSALPPIEVSGAGDVTMKVGEFIRVDTPGADEVSSDNPDALKAEGAYSDDTAEYVAGAEAIASGTAVLTVYDGDELLYQVTVTVEG